MTAPTIPLHGTQVTQLRIDYAVTLSFDAKYHLRLESPFTLIAQNRSSVIQPGTNLGSMGFLLTLHQATVAQAATDEAGNLRIEFIDERVLLCSPDEAYEAWNLSGPHGLLYVCLPGSGLATWSATAD